MDREKLINDLEAIWVCCKNKQNIKIYDETDREMFKDWTEIINDTLVLMKEQKAMLVLSQRECETLPNHYERKGFCPKCHQVVEWLLNRSYCGFCGQAVKWE